MDYVDIIKKAAATTWKHPILWLFGFFAGIWTGYQGFNYSFTSEDWLRFSEGGRIFGWSPPADVDAEARALIGLVDRAIDSGAWIWWAAAVLGILLVLAVFALVIRVAAQGGLIYLSQEALDGHATRGMAGWREGFRAWFRVFGVAFLMALPLVVVGLLTLVAGVGAFFFVVTSEGEPLSVGTVLGWVALLAVVALLMIPASIILGVLREVAWRHVVLGHMTVGAAIGAAWRETWGKRGVWGMWLAQVVVGIAYGLIVGVAALLVGVAVLLPLGLFAATADTVSGALPWIAIAGAILLLLLIPAILAGSAYSAFRSTAWTEFYDRMMETSRRATGSVGPPLVS